MAILRGRTGCRRLHRQEACDGLRQLTVHLIGDQHNVRHYETEIHAGQVTLDVLKDAHLQDSRFLHDQGRGVALAIAELSMRHSRRRRNAKRLYDPSFPQARSDVLL